VIRVRLTYRKLGRARFIGHLDMINVFTSAFRRSGLPVAFSRGHHPMPRFRFSPGLPVGCESDCEVLDVDLTRALRADGVAAALGPELPEGLSVVAARAVPRNGPPVEADLTGMRYRIGIAGIGNGDGTWIDERLAAFLRSTTFVIRKQTGKGERVIDARPLVARLAREDPSQIEMDLRFDIAGSVKPSELIAALLGIDVAAARALPIRKTRCFYRADIEQPGSPAAIGEELQDGQV
jgi:radical SAM-linked protein